MVRLLWPYAQTLTCLYSSLSTLQSTIRSATSSSSVSIDLPPSRVLSYSLRAPFHLCCKQVAAKILYMLPSVLPESLIFLLLFFCVISKIYLEKTRWILPDSIFLFFKKILLIYLTPERMRERTWAKAGGVVGRGKGKEAGFPLSRGPHVGLNPRPWDHDLTPKHNCNWLGHPGALPDSFVSFLPHSFLGLWHENWSHWSVVGLSWDWDFKEYSQEAAETPFVLGRLPIFSGLTWIAYLYFFVGGKKSTCLLICLSSQVLGLRICFICPLGFIPSPV